MEVHPDDLGLNAVSPMEGRSKRRNTEGSEVETFPPEKAYLTKPVLDALMANLRIKRNEDDIGINEAALIPRRRLLSCPRSSRAPVLFVALWMHARSGGVEGLDLGITM